MKHTPTDVLPEELPGYRKKSFTMPFDGGEIRFEHLDGIYGYSDLVIKKLQKDAPDFMKPSGTSLICFNIDETVMTDKIISEIVAVLTDERKHFTRVCFVGADRKCRRAIEKALDGIKNFALKFTDDFEFAKQWLVCEKPE